MSTGQLIVPVCLADLEANAYASLPKNALDYYRSGANDMQTLRDNQDAFERIRLRPRILRDVSKVSTETTLLGHTVRTPICFSPTAMQRMAHDEGEKATARAAAKAKTCMILSSWSTTTAEDTIKAGKDVPVVPESDSSALPLYWFQLYVYHDRAAAERLIRRVEKAGYKALVITVDTPFLGRRLADVRNVFKLPNHLTMANFETKESNITMANVLEKTQTTQQKESSLAAYVVSQIDPTLSWKDIAWVRSITNLPIVVKGVLTAEDAKAACELGCEGILVSNHGGRQLDGVLATIDALPEVVHVANEYSKKQNRPIEVYLDGGIRKGTDVLKALALGAKAVFLGRPVLYGLAHNGEEGVSLMLELLQKELELSMALAGCCSTADLGPHNVQFGPYGSPYHPAHQSRASKL
ncbi:Hydroxyacid oxidase 1 [Actinomortierella ambigua]|uniref:Oxidase FUB9 n=1 Tax=Actinomortierella ambigua TaxID=1343610 RepID=A0A9P6U1D7_9FUNG|nr:Hydroxyacid oxidase 1 [Actinomortierella ambigua]